MLARTGSTAGKDAFGRHVAFMSRCAPVKSTKMASLAAFDSFVALSRPFTFDERPLGQEEGGVSAAAHGSFASFALITPSRRVLGGSGQ